MVSYKHIGKVNMDIDHPLTYLVLYSPGSILDKSDQQGRGGWREGDKPSR